ncbi:Mitochondrial substrate carrier family protein B [Bienertia sinuspersici]
MQTEARVGVVVDGGQRDGCTRKYVQVKQQQKAQIGTISQLLAGGVAGAVSKTCTAPLARLTILFQIQGMHSDASKLRKACIWREASRIIREEGIRAFWKGNLVTIAHRLPYSSVSFYSYEQYKKVGIHLIPGLESDSEHLSAHIFVRLSGGFLAGVTAATATYPLDLVRTRLAAQTNATYYTGIWHALRTISKEEGMLGLYKGLGATLLSVGPNIAISFSVYETLRSQWQLKRPDDSPVLVSLACGVFLVLHPPLRNRLKCWLCTNCLTTLTLMPEARNNISDRFGETKNAVGRSWWTCTRIQVGILGTFKDIVRSEGLRGLYRGILPEYYKVVPSVGIVFMTYEAMKKLLSN